MLSMLKFGGNALSSAENLQLLTLLVSRQVGQPEAFPVVVVSAMKGIREDLAVLAHLVREGKSQKGISRLETIKQRHRDLASEVVHDPTRYHLLSQALEESLSNLDQEVLQLQLLPYGSAEVPFQITRVVTWGERLAVLLVTTALEDAGIATVALHEAMVITARPSLDEAITGSHYLVDPPVLLHQTRSRACRQLLPILGQRLVPVVAGGLAQAESGMMTTLGEQAAEYTAALLASALHCVSLTIYTDASGILSADPDLVPDTFPLTTLSYEEATYLLSTGENLLHPQTVPTLAAAGISLQVRSLGAPQAPGTLVSAIAASSSTAALALARAVSLMTIKARPRADLATHLALILHLLSQARVKPLMLHLTTNQHLSFLVEEDAADAVIRSLEQALKPWEIRCQTGLAACQCVGSSFARQSLHLTYAAIALLGERIPVVSQGFSDLGMVLVVRAEDGPRAIRCLHRDLLAPVVPSGGHPCLMENEAETLS